MLPPSFKLWIYDELTPYLLRYGWRPVRNTYVAAALKGKRFGYDNEDAIRLAASKVEAHTMVSFERLASLWQQVQYLDRFNIEGDLVECGVWKGGAAGMMALAHLASNRNEARQLHLFDSFEGLPAPTEKDDPAAHGYMNIDTCVAPLEICRDLLEQKVKYPKNALHYHVGWFEEQIPKANEIKKIALLRLDGDWYESTKVCLDNLYSRVVKGGVIVIDDYGHWAGCRKAVDEFVEKLGQPVLFNHVDYSARSWVKLD